MKEIHPFGETDYNYYNLQKLHQRYLQTRMLVVQQ